MLPPATNLKDWCVVAAPKASRPAAWKHHDTAATLLEAVAIARWGTFNDGTYQSLRRRHGLCPPTLAGLNRTSAMEGHYKTRATLLARSRDKQFLLLEELGSSLAHNAMQLADVTQWAARADVRIVTAGQMTCRATTTTLTVPGRSTDPSSMTVLWHV